MTGPQVALLRPAVAGRAARSQWPALHPQWWLYPVAGLGWMWLLAAPLLAPDPMGGHGSALTGAPATAFGTGQVVSHVAAMLAMIAAMTPLIEPNVRYAALRSPRRIRLRVTRDVVAGWAAVWLAAATAITMATVLLIYLLGDVTAVVVAAAVAVGWQYSNSKQRSLVRCSRVFAPPLGRDAGPATRRFGSTLGRDCLLSCWPLMALMVALHHFWPVVAALLALTWYERHRRPHHDPGTSLVVAGIVAVAAAGIGLNALAG